MSWSILTPDRSAHWDTKQLTFGPGVSASEAPSEDEARGVVARVLRVDLQSRPSERKTAANHIPVRHWSTMPESAIIPELIAEATSRERRMCETKPKSAPTLSLRAQLCPFCAMRFMRAEAAIFMSELPSRSSARGPDTAVVLVGEQPGDQEDLEGRPFVGPSGQLLDRALAEAGLDRGQLYLTGAVRHFRFEERGKRRIHKTASRSQIAACQPWLDAELALIRPTLIVCLGNTALLSVLGRAAKVSEVRGTILPHRHALGVTATVHPSFVLPGAPDEEYPRFVADLRFAREQLRLLGINAP